MKRWKVDLRITEIKPDGTERVRLANNEMTISADELVLVAYVDGKPIMTLWRVS